MNTVTQRIVDFNKDLLPDKVQLKSKAMAASAFSFFRGTCHLFYQDLAKVRNFPASPHVWVCGDLHIENFGSYKGDNRMEYFDLNDFDESLLAPLNWEVARMLTSIIVGFTELEVAAPEVKELVAHFMTAYTATLREGKAHYIDPRIATGITRKFLKAVKKRREKDLLKKMIRVDSKGRAVIRLNDINHFEVEPELKAKLMDKLTGWLNNTTSWPCNYKVRDVAFRLAGTGSIGLKRYMFLLQNKADKEKYIIVEFKQVRASSLAPYVKIAQPKWPSEAARLVAIKKRMQNVSTALTSTVSFEGDSYVLQEMQPMADKINFKSLCDSKKDLLTVITDMAVLTASAQLRSGGRDGSAITDELIAYAHETGWQKKLINYAVKYAAKVKDDYAEYMADLSEITSL